MPTKSAPTPPASAQMCRALQAPEFTAAAAPPRPRSRGTRRRRVCVGADEQAVAAGVDAAGRDGGEHQAARRRAGWRPPGRGSMTSRAARRTGHQRRGDVGDEAVGARPCGQAIVAVVCLTGSSGTSPHSSTPAMPAMTAISRAMRWDGTRVDGMRRALARSTMRAACPPVNAVGS